MTHSHVLCRVHIRVLVSYCIRIILCAKDHLLPAFNDENVDCSHSAPPLSTSSARACAPALGSVGPAVSAACPGVSILNLVIRTGVT
jgi:hypothetical protein